MTPELYYYIDLTASGCNVNVAINGFPAYQLNAKFKTYFAKPINELLIGRKNRVDIELIPVEDSMDLESQKAIDFFAQGSIKLYHEGQISSLEEGEKIIKIDQKNILKSLFFFDNTIFDFSHIMKDLPVIQDEKKIKEYAMHLLQVLKNKNTQALYHEFEPKFKDHQIAYFHDVNQFYENFESYMSNNFYPNLSNNEVQKEALIARPFCDKKIWEVKLFPNQPLFGTEANTSGDIFEMEIFVGMVKGEMKVVR